MANSSTLDQIGRNTAGNSLFVGEELSCRNRNAGGQSSALAGKKVETMIDAHP